MRVWVDLTNSPHVLVFAPLVRLLRGDGHDVEVTCRDFAQTVQLAARHGLGAITVGTHGGGGRLGKARALVGRTRELARWARTRPGGPFDLGLSHGSTEAPLVCRRLGVPHTAMFDYEWATLQHSLNGRTATRVLVPDAIGAASLRRYGITATKLRTYPGLKEEYYLHGVDLDPAVGAALALDPARVLAVVRTPPEVALYHRGAHTDVFADVLRRLGAEDGVTAVVLPRTPEQGVAVRGLGLPNLIVPETAIDAQSLLAIADLAVSAGGTMNREAVVLGCPVHTTFAGRLGAVDARLIAEGRLRRLDRAADLVLAKRTPGLRPLTRDPRELLDRCLP